MIGCEDQTLGQVVGVVGTPYTLHYQSDRTPGSRAVEFAVSGPVVPPHLAEYRVTVRVAGRELVQSYPPEPDRRVLFAWDGKDDTGAVPLGARFATIEVAEMYDLNGELVPWNTRIWGGTLGSWDTRAHGLGGWSFNVHHFFDPLDRILYLGSGGQRSGKELGVVQQDGDETLIASENGLAVYVFSTYTGHHLRTVNALTGATVYSFTYNGDILTHIDNGGQGTNVSSGTITGPFGEVTAAAVGPDEYWASIANGGSSMGFTYTPFTTIFADVEPPTPMADGLLLTVTDPNGGHWSYQYDGRGRLKHQSDAGDGSIGVTRGAVSTVPPGEIEEAYSVNLGTGGGKNFKHEVVELKDGSAHRVIDTPDGQTTIAIDRDLNESGTYPWGSFARVRDPGDRLKLTTGLPFRLGSMSSDYRVNPPDRLDLLAVSNFTQTTDWNGAETRTTGRARRSRPPRPVDVRSRPPPTRWGARCRSSSPGFLRLRSATTRAVRRPSSRAAGL